MCSLYSLSLLAFLSIQTINCFVISDVGENLSTVLELFETVSDAVGMDGYNIQAFTNVLKQFSHLGDFGTVLPIIFSLLDSGDNEQIDYVKEEFKKLSDKLDKIEEKVNSLYASIQFVESSIDYRKKRDEIMQVQRSFHKYLEYAEEYTKQKLKFVCQEHHPDELLNWIHDKVVAPKIGPFLFPSIIEGSGYDNRMFTAWAKIVGVDAVTAAQLMAPCYNLTDVAPSADLAQHNIETAALQIDQILDAVVDYQNDLQRNFVDQAEIDTSNWLAEGGSNGHLTDAIYEKLYKKYDWLYWAVHVYDGVSQDDKHFYASGDPMGSNRKGYKHLLQKHGKNIAINWSHKDDWFNRTAEIEKTNWYLVCDRYYKNARKMNEYLEKCLNDNDVEYSMILVIRDNHYEMKHTGIPYYFHNWCEKRSFLLWSWKTCSNVVIGL